MVVQYPQGVGPGAKVFCPECIAKDETSADHVTFQILALLLRAGYCLLAPFATFMACLFAKRRVLFKNDESPSKQAR